MKLRNSNRTKRFSSSVHVDISDSEQAAPAQKDHDSSDEDFFVDAKQLSDQDDHDVDLQQSDFELQDGKQSTPSRKKKNKRSWAPDRPLGEVQPYPTDTAQKWTRTYVGPVKRWTRLMHLIEYWFGDKGDRKHIFNFFLNLWWDFELLPPKLPHGSRQSDMARKSWVPDSFAQDQEDNFHRWYQKHLSGRVIPHESTLLDKASATRWFFPKTEDEMSVLLGHVSNQKEYLIKQGEGISFSDSGLPVEDEGSYEPQNGGWLLNVGGIVLSMGWAPIKGQVDQLLAMAIVPYSDQAFYKDLNDAPKTLALREGTIQIWKFEANKDSKGVLRPARSPPTLSCAVCFSWGRVTRMQWCPISLPSENQTRLLAILCGDRNLRIIEIKQDIGSDSKGTFEEIQEPMATIEPPREHTLEINCFTWINMNRVAVALSDGSVAVWSLSPCLQLQRHPIHSSPIMDIVSSYPSSPYIVATMPMGGEFTITDLNRPTAETTYHGNPLVSLQPNVVSWSDHLRGFASIWPTAFPGTSTISFVQSRVFPLSRHICTVEGQTTCLAFGICHPFLLAGSSDGSVWALNVMRKIASHRERTQKLKVFQHEYRQPPQAEATEEEAERTARRGACRILHGFMPEANIHPLGTRIAKQSRSKSNKVEKKKAGKKKADKLEDGRESDIPTGMDGENFTLVSGPIIIHDPLTRITTLAWNPNVEFSWWAAAAMGSGLVRVMDLGIDNDWEDSEQHGGQTEPGDLDDIAVEDESGSDSGDDVDMAAYD
ncbi:WD40 repeat-like protein [Hypoxylon cercidicola]|nr:WD40 repeat-like protein [Hypoxylon cercidicola]